MQKRTYGFHFGEGDYHVVEPGVIIRAREILETKHGNYSPEIIGDVRREIYLLQSGLVVVQAKEFDASAPKELASIEIMSRTRKGLAELVKSLRLDRPADNPSRL